MKTQIEMIYRVMMADLPPWYNKNKIACDYVRELISCKKLNIEIGKLLKHNEQKSS